MVCTSCEMLAVQLVYASVSKWIMSFRASTSAAKLSQ